MRRIKRPAHFAAIEKALATSAISRYTPLMALLPESNNFADVRETANKLQAAAQDDTVKRLAGLVAALAVRADLLEREVERLERAKKSA
jgi:hypothetical protein